MLRAGLLLCSLAVALSSPFRHRRMSSALGPGASPSRHRAHEPGFGSHERRRDYDCTTDLQCCGIDLQIMRAPSGATTCDGLSSQDLKDHKCGHYAFEDPPKYCRNHNSKCSERGPGLIGLGLVAKSKKCTSTTTASVAQGRRDHKEAFRKHVEVDIIEPLVERTVDNPLPENYREDPTTVTDSWMGVLKWSPECDNAAEDKITFVSEWCARIGAVTNHCWVIVETSTSQYLVEQEADGTNEGVPFARVDCQALGAAQEDFTKQHDADEKFPWRFNFVTPDKVGSAGALKTKMKFQIEIYRKIQNVVKQDEASLGLGWEEDWIAKEDASEVLAGVVDNTKLAELRTKFGASTAVHHTWTA